MPTTQHTRRFIAAASPIRQDRKRAIPALHGSSVSHNPERPVLTSSGRRCNGAGLLSFLSVAAPHSCTSPSSPSGVNAHKCAYRADEIRENRARGSARPVASRTLLMRYTLAQASADRMRSSGRDLNQHSPSFSARTGSMRDRAAPDRAQDHGFAGFTIRREMGGVSHSEHRPARPVSFHSATVDEAVATYPGRRSDRGVRPLVCGFRGHFHIGDDQRLTARNWTTQGFLIGAREPLPCSWVRVVATSSPKANQ